MQEAELNRISGAIVDCAVRVHTKLGPGLYESVCESALAYELEQRGHRVERQKPVHFQYERLTMQEVFRADLIVDGCVLVELKSIEALGQVHFKQVQTYLKLSGFKLGLLLNFGAPRMKEGIHRVVNGF